MHPSGFDIYTATQLNPLLERHGVAPLRLDWALAGRDVAGAARVVLALLQSAPRLRRRHPRALTDGLAGGFARHVLGGRAFRRLLTPEARANITGAFTANLGVRVRQIFSLRQDVRAQYPLGLTPQQREWYAEWLMCCGHAQHGLRDEEMLWHLFECAEDPACGLMHTYVCTPSWQAAVPHGLTAFGWRALKEHVAHAYGLEGHGPVGTWLEAARLTPPYEPASELRMLLVARPELAADYPGVASWPPLWAWMKRHRLAGIVNRAWRARLRADIHSMDAARPGINIVAHFSYHSGLQQAALSTVQGLTHANWRTELRDLPVSISDCSAHHRPLMGLELFPITILNAGLNTFVDEAWARTGLHMRRGVHRIAYCYWEAEQIPTDWIAPLQRIDEIWAPTTFVADIVRRAVKTPVHAMLPGLHVPAVASVARTRFGLRDDAFLFLFMFDLCSTLARKNPLDLIRAFRNAFRPDEPAQLAIKMLRGHSNPPDAERLREAARAAGVALIEETLTREETLGLVATCDAYVSLHRSEGLGLTMAEAMLLGKPTIATAYSGNLDFMTRENSLLVDYARATLDVEAPPYAKGACWAQPSLTHAAQHMRWAFANRDAARALGAVAQRQLRGLFSAENAGRRMATRLAACRA